MQTYRFHPKTKEFLYAEEAYLDPLETETQGKEVYLLPAYSTFTVPLILKKNTACVWNGNEWELVEDYRGKTVWKSYNESMEITELGAIPDGYSLERPEPPPPSKEEQNKVYENSVQAHLNATVQSRGYTDVNSCLSYKDSTDETWRRESWAFNAWRDAVWHKCYEILNAFMAGKIKQPTVDEVIAQLPKIDWNGGVA